MIELVLMFPGTGVRKTASELKAYHLDQIGYFAASYYRWFVSVPLFKQKIFYGRNFKGDRRYIGFASNWRDLVRLVDKVLLKGVMSDDEYRNMVEKYRKTTEYRQIDLKLLELFGERERPISWYVKEYRKFINDVTEYLNK